MNDALERLNSFLSKNGRTADKVQQLTPDASTREYFRVIYSNNSAIACVYPEPFTASEQTYLDVTNVFRRSSVSVAEVFEYDESLGIIILEDFGDTILRDVLAASDPQQFEKLLNSAIDIIAQIQLATKTAFELNSIASQLKFDLEKLSWELEFFKTHYFQSLKKIELDPELSSGLNLEFLELAKVLEDRAKVLCHRDFHAANIMVSGDSLKIIDHQDARIGSAAYDLVSLLLDRVLDVPDRSLLDRQIGYFLDAREKCVLPRFDHREFMIEFDLVSVQRCLKAIGTFSNQTANCGKTNYVQYIRPMFRIVLDACQRLDRFPALQTAIKGELQIP